MKFWRPAYDIDYISRREAELQLIYGYKIDRDTYKDLMSKLKKQKHMKLNVTDQTVTFPCPVNKLKGRLMDFIRAQLLRHNMANMYWTQEYD
jgi:hypothetical protein